MIPYPGCESAQTCQRCGMVRHTAQFAYVGDSRDSVCCCCRSLETPAIAESRHKPFSTGEKGTPTVPRYAQTRREQRVARQTLGTAPDIRIGPITRVSGSRVKFSVYVDAVYQETVVCHVQDAPYHRKRMVEKYAQEAIK